MASLSDDEQRPDAKVVSKFHTHDDLDTSKLAHHHTIGTDPNQAAAGSHRHDGNDSVKLLDGIEITGATVETQVDSITAALVRLGAVDSRS